MEENKDNNPQSVKQEQEPKKFEVSSIFKPHHIEIIYNSQDPIKDCSLYFESNYRAKTGKPDFEKAQLMAKAEFAVNVLIFLKKEFPYFEDPTLCKLLNLYCDLIEMTSPKYKEETNFLTISKLKIEDFKMGLKELKLLPKMKSEVALSKEKDKKITPEGKFFLNKEELTKLLDYIKKEFIPFIQIWFYINNEQRHIEDQKISIIINKPIESLPLNLATLKVEEEKKEEEKEEMKEEEKEEEKKEEEKEEEKKEETQKEEEPESILDILNKLITNEDTKKIILEKIEELNKEVDNKIEGRMKDLETKLKEIEDAGKGGKKK